MSRNPLPHPNAVPITLALVVEPDADSRELYAAILADIAQEIVYATDGPEALAIAIGRRPMLVVTEIRLPRVDGLTLCKFLKNDPITAGAWLVVVTADARPETLARAKSAGAHAVLTKPATSEALISAISGLVASAVHAGADRERRRHEPHEPIDVTSPPPAAHCPTCMKPLRHQRTFVGGVKKDRERWEHYACPQCHGMFAYRHRTGKMQRE
jgi:CheY-like chemotaxis protein